VHVHVTLAHEQPGDHYFCESPAWEFSLDVDALLLQRVESLLVPLRTLHAVCRKHLVKLFVAPTDKTNGPCPDLLKLLLAAQLFEVLF